MVEDFPAMSLIRQELLLLIYRRFLKRVSKIDTVISKYKNNLSEKLLKVFSELYNYLSMFGDKQNDHLIQKIKNVYEDDSDQTNINNLLIRSGITNSDKIIEKTIEDINDISDYCKKVRDKLVKISGLSKLILYKINDVYSVFVLNLNELIINDYIIPIREKYSLPANDLYGNIYNPLFQFYDKDVVSSLKDKVEISFFMPFVRINNDYLNKLKSLYRGDKNKFETRVFCMIARYESFTYSNPGLQGSLTDDIFEKIKREYKIEAECFASPLNCHIGNYYSAFKDTDKYFGSNGSFFDNFYPKYGSFEANPPFIAPLMNAMVDRFEHLLKNTTKSILFFITVPTWKNSEYYIKLLNSKYLISSSEIYKNKHYYVSGIKYKTGQDKWLINTNTTWFLLYNER